MLYYIEYSTDGGDTWEHILFSWHISRRGDEPGDFWSQSLCWGRAVIKRGRDKPVLVRFRNTGKRNYLRAEAHLVYSVPSYDEATRVTFAWTDDFGPHQASNEFSWERPVPWHLPTKNKVETKWVEFEPIAQ